jgi:hypothetical protein
VGAVNGKNGLGRLGKKWGDLLKKDIWFFNWTDNYGPCPPQQLIVCFRHLIPTGGPDISENCVNSCLDRHLCELQKITPGVVDLRFENVKWYHFVNFAIKVVVLCYSLAVIHTAEAVCGICDMARVRLGVDPLNSYCKMNQIKI